MKLKMLDWTKAVVCAFELTLVTACTQTPPEPRESGSKANANAKLEASCDAKRLELSLSAPHDPPIRADLQSICADPVPQLSEFAKDTRQRGLVRLRSLEALGELGGTQAIEVLSERATATNDLPSIRRSALVALGKATVASDRRRERVAVRSLTDTDVHVRLAAVKLLGQSDSTDARSALEQARARESEALVRDEIDRIFERD